MSVRKRLLQISALVLICALIAIVGYHVGTLSPSEDDASSFFTQKDVLQLWYTDDAYTDFLNSAAVAYTEAQSQIRVEPKLVSATEYLEEINRASLAGQGPDLYMLSNDSLEKAYLAGLATQIPGTAQMGTEHFPQTAINAVTYHDKLIGFPLSFDTCALLYNKTYLEQMGDTELPTNVQEILDFADGHDAPENVESFFTWDVSRILYNFSFASDAMSLGGERGDDAEAVAIYNTQTVQSMQIFQRLSQFFSLGPVEMNYEKVMQDFINGKLIFTLATTDAVKQLEDARADGSFSYEYGVSLVPNPTSEYSGNAISVTNAIVINGYSEYKKAAGDFGQYLTEISADSLYEKTGKMAADRSVDLSQYSGEKALEGFYAAYEHSTPMPKLMELSNFWVYYEVVLDKVWNGADVNEQMRLMSESVMTQVTGEKYEEEILEVPELAATVEEDKGME